jgi:hypothetical protein
MKYLFLLIVSVSLFSCTKNQIIGKWKLNEINFEKQLKQIPEEQREFAIEMYNSAFEQVKGKLAFIFEEGGKLTIESPDETGKIAIEIGVWSISEDKKKLTTEIEGQKETMNIKDLSEKKLTIELNENGQEMEMMFVK